MQISPIYLMGFMGLSPSWFQSNLELKSNRAQACSRDVRPSSSRGHQAEAQASQVRLSGTPSFIHSKKDYCCLEAPRKQKPLCTSVHAYLLIYNMNQTKKISVSSQANDVDMVQKVDHIQAIHQSHVALKACLEMT